MAANGRELFILGLGEQTERGNLMVDYLREAGYAARAAAAGELAEAKPLGALVDLSPFSTDGWGILLELKKDPATRDIPLLPVYLSEEGKIGGVFQVAGFFIMPVDEGYLARKLAVLGLTDEVDMYDLQTMIISRRGEEAVAKALGGIGFDIVNAYTGKEGYAVGSITTIYMAFCSLMLPDMSAFELLEKFRLHPHLRNVPFFIMMKDELKEGEKKALSKEIAALVRKKELTREEFLASFRRRA